MSDRTTAGNVLVWGCQTTGELVRGRLRGKLPPSRPGAAVEVAVACPCGEEHRVDAITRPRRPGECYDVDPVDVRGLPKRRRR
jgi:hypothetical protein